VRRLAVEQRKRRSNLRILERRHPAGLRIVRLVGKYDPHCLNEENVHVA
jgi:hypothetical protein